MTIYDIARIAGVSASTVPRVMNNEPGIKRETRGRALALLKQYNYSPSETARRLVNRASRMIGILIEDIRYAHHMGIAYYIEEEMGKHGYRSLILNTDLMDDKKVEAVKVLAQKRMDGVILVGSTFETGAVKRAPDVGLSAVSAMMTNGYLNLPSIERVLVDEREGVENCVELMHTKGYEKLAFVHPNHTRSSPSKEQGFVQRVGRHDFEREGLWIYECPVTLKDGYAMMERILGDHPDVGGVIFKEDLSAVNAIRALVDRNIKMPERVAMIEVDNSKYYDICYPKPTSLNNRMVEMNLEAAGILFNSLEGREDPDQIMLFSRIVEREDTQGLRVCNKARKRVRPVDAQELIERSYGRNMSWGYINRTASLLLYVKRYRLRNVEQINERIGYFLDKMHNIY